MRAAEKWLREQGRREIDEDSIFAAHQRLQEMEDEVIKTTKKIRRQRERKRQYGKSRKNKLQAPDAAGAATDLTPDAPLNASGNVLPFDEII